jgi:hypothetical protein
MAIQDLNRPTWRLVALSAMGVVALFLAGIPFFLEEMHQLTGGVELNGYRLATAGNSLLALSAALYVAHLLMGLREAGTWATRLATLGALILALDLGSHFLGLSRISQAPDHSPIDAYDVISLVVPLVVAWYLIVEKVTESRAAGALVMPIVLSLVGAEMWFLAEHAGSRDFLLTGYRNYWGQAYLVAHIVGYGAFVLAAAVGILYLLRYHLDPLGIRHPRASRFLPDTWRAQTLIVALVGIGVPVFVIALFFAAGWFLGSAGWSDYAWVKNLWVVLVLGFYASFLYVMYSRSLAGHHMAWWAVSGLGLTLAAFLGAHLLTLALPGAHA